MKRILLFTVGMTFLLSCLRLNDSPTTINREITSLYLLNGNLDVYLSNNQVFRYKGKPGIVTIPIGNQDLSKYETCFVLHVSTGTTTATIVSSAIIKLDDLEVLNTSDFSKNIGEYTFEICNLNPTSVLALEIKGEPGSYLDIWIEGKLKELTVTDCDGNIYKTVTIGNQVWMAENLKTTKFNDCTPIPYIIDDGAWYSLRSPSYAIQNFEMSNFNKYGALYNYYAAGTAKLCPTEWHVPSKDEFRQLVDYLGGDELAYPELIEGGSSGFNLLFAGLRDYPGNFSDNSVGVLWLSTYHWFVTMTNVGSPSGLNWWSWEDPISNNRAFSVRCVKD